MSDPQEVPAEVSAKIGAIDDYLGEVVEQGRPIEALVAIKMLGTVMDRRVKEAARAAADGVWSWSDVGDALGISKQAAHQKLSGRVLALHERLDRRERIGHEKLTRKFEHARETLSRHQAARDPKRAESIKQKLDDREKARHEQLSRQMQRTHEKLKRHHAEREER